MGPECRNPFPGKLFNFKAGGGPHPRPGYSGLSGILLNVTVYYRWMEEAGSILSEYAVCNVVVLVSVMLGVGGKYFTVNKKARHARHLKVEP
jgi:hypothetical protein